MNQVYMDIQSVERVAEELRAFAEQLETVTLTLEADILVLETIALKGHIGAQAMESYLSTLKPLQENLAQRFQETARDIDDSVLRWISPEDNTL